MALSCKLRLARISAEMRFQDRAECSNINSKVLTFVISLYEDNKTGDTTLVESYTGQVVFEKYKERKYNGFLISSSGYNLANIF